MSTTLSPSSFYLDEALSQEATPTKEKLSFGSRDANGFCKATNYETKQFFTMPHPETGHDIQVRIVGLYPDNNEYLLHPIQGPTDFRVDARTVNKYHSENLHSHDEDVHANLKSPSYFLSRNKRIFLAEAGIIITGTIISIMALIHSANKHEEKTSTSDARVSTPVVSVAQDSE